MSQRKFRKPPTYNYFSPYEITRQLQKNDKIINRTRPLTLNRKIIITKLLEHSCEDKL
jgi:hypothetical protein